MRRLIVRIIPAVLAGFLVGTAWMLFRPSQTPSSLVAGLQNSGGMCGGEASQTLAFVGRSDQPLRAAISSGQYLIRPAFGPNGHSTLAVIEPPTSSGVSIAQARLDVPSLHSAGELRAQSARSDYTSCKYDLGDKPKASALADAGAKALSDAGVMPPTPADDAVVYLLSDDPTQTNGFILTVLVELPNRPLSAAHAYGVEIHADGSIGAYGPAEWFDLGN